MQQDVHPAAPSDEDVWGCVPSALLDGCAAAPVGKLVRCQPRDAHRERDEAKGWLITRHALTRFRQLFPRQSRRDLRELCRGSHLVTTVNGTEHWRAARPTRIQFRVRDGVLVTVLPANERHRRRVCR